MARSRINPMGSKLNDALKEHAGDETTERTEFINLPPGITGGIAQFADGRIGKYKSGQYQGKQYCYLAGIVVEPKSATYVPKTFVEGRGVVAMDPETVEVEGQRTSMTIPLCDTKNVGGKVTSQSEHVDRLLNELRLLGVGTKHVGSIEDVEALLRTLVEEISPYFKFTTSASDPTLLYPTPRTWENWFGAKGLEDFVTEESDDDLVELAVPQETGEPEENDTEDGEEDDSGEGGGNKGGEEDTEELTSDQLLELALLADTDEGEEGDGAAAQLEELAKSMGVDHNKYESWEMFATKVISTEDQGDNEGGGGEEDEEGEEEDEDIPPEVGQVTYFKPKGARRLSEVEVRTVNQAERTCTLKRLSDNRVFKKISWDRLEMEEGED